MLFLQYTSYSDSVDVTKSFICNSDGIELIDQCLLGQTPVLQETFNSSDPGQDEPKLHILLSFRTPPPQVTEQLSGVQSLHAEEILRLSLFYMSACVLPVSILQLVKSEILATNKPRNAVSNDTNFLSFRNCKFFNRNYIEAYSI